MPNSMETFASRLASFDALLPATKKRASDPKGTRKLKWPHSNPSPARLAHAGFYYNPTTSCPDNVTCYLCNSNLDGWEETDDPIEEHISFCKDCGWAVVVDVEKSIEQQTYESQNPLDERMLDARRMTFATGWPHENKRGWLCKIEKLIYAGWHYAPTPESDDSVKCSYCSLSLDGWEPKDKPFEEHHRRSPDCLFFQTADSKKPKAPTRSRKDRTSKASRMSTQSTITVASEAPSMEDVESDRDSILSTATTKSRSKKGVKKATRTRQKATKKKPALHVEEPVISSSFIEPEDDDFSVKVDRSPEPPAKGRKRQSHQISQDDQFKTGSEDIAMESRPAKRRAASKRSSALPAQSVDVTSRSRDEDVPMQDAADTAVSRKSTKPGKKSNATRTRKASVLSTASKASMRAAISDEDGGMDSDLELDLDQPLSDEEEEAQAATSQKASGRRLTRNKPNKKTASASSAPTRRVTRASTIPTETAALDASIADPHAGNDEGYSGVTHPDTAVEEAAEPVQKKGRKARSKKARTEQHSLEPEGAQTDVAKQDQEVVTDQAVKKPAKKQPRSRQVSRQKPSRNTGISELRSNQADETAPHKEGSPDVLLGEDEHESEKEPIVATKTRGKKAPLNRGGQSGKYAEQQDADVEDHGTPAPKDGQHSTEHAKLEVDIRPDLEDGAVEGDQSAGIVRKTTRGAKGKAAGKKKAGKPKTKPKNTVQNVPASPTATKPLTPAASPQSSDAENQPPSSRPSTVNPPVGIDQAPILQAPRIPLSDRTPGRSPSKHTFSKLQTSMPWTAIDLELVFQNSPAADKENALPTFSSGNEKLILDSPDRKLSVEQWIQQSAKRGEERLRTECERLVGIFEDQGNRALRTLEGIVCVE